VKRWAGILLLAVLTGIAPVGSPARASATFKVNSIADTGEVPADQGDGRCDSDPVTDGKQCTLRAAIEEANASGALDEIVFNLPGAGVHTIAVDDQLPKIKKPVIIDGYTQEGSVENTIPSASNGTNAVLTVEITRSGAAPLFIDGLEFGAGASGSVVRGLVLRGLNEAILIQGGTGFKVEGNFIGTNAAGTAAVGNTRGVYLNGEKSLIGGSSPAARNIISASSFDAIYLLLGEGNHKIIGNLIGTAKDAVTDLGNGSNPSGGRGVFIYPLSNTVKGNTIAYNSLQGVEVSNVGSTGNTILSNYIFSNEKLGIDLPSGTQDANGVTENDAGDPDFGPNRLQNYPVLTEATSAAAFDTVKGTLNSKPNKVFVIQFFKNTAKDPSGYGEGQTFLGQIEVTTDPTGNVSFTFATDSLSLNQFVTATATSASTDDTSEFSNAVIVQPPPVET
jgi:CSLREA domain-containing protein